MEKVDINFPCESLGCPHCEATTGRCALQQTEACDNMKNWTEVYEHCPLKEAKHG